MLHGKIPVRTSVVHGVWHQVVRPHNRGKSMQQGHQQRRGSHSRIADPAVQILAEEAPLTLR